MNNRDSVSLTLVILSMAALISGSTATTLVYALDHSTSSSNNGSPSSTPSSSGSLGSTSSEGGSGSSGSSGLGSAGPSSGTSSSGVASGGSSNNPTPSSQGGSTAHCDTQGYPSCSSLGSEAGKNAAGTSCPSGHSKAFCSAYNVAAGPSTTTTTTTTTTKPGSSTQKGNTSASSVSNNSTSSHQADAAHCDQTGYQSCYSMGFEDGKSNPGIRCSRYHIVNFCAGWNTSAGNPPTKTTPRVAKVTEIALGAAPGPHTLEYIQAFNIAAGNPYKPGTKQYDDYQAGLDDAMKAGRDCDKMDTCGGPNLLGNYVKGVLHLDDKQYCGNGFGVYSNVLCSFQKGCTANIIGVVACPTAPRPGGEGEEGSTTTTTIKYIGGIPGLGLVQTANASDRIKMMPSNASDFANNDPKTLTLDFVNPTGPDSIGNYYIKGEVVNNGNTTLQSLKITAHWYDSTHKLIGVTFGYPDSVLQPLDSGKRTTFTILVDGHSDLLGKPKFVELSYDWQ
ncbi:MAG: FxLYD domain-containing protein [Candidatus Nitrosopolaris sp.]